MKMEISLEDLKQIELNLLITFADFCDKNNFRYYLCGGTLLGAIRHKGFIPWDDDIDILMPRPDYNRLLNQKSKNISEYIKLVDWKTGGTRYPFIKVVDTRTKIKEKYVDSATNVWIDVFPIDGNPASDIKNRFLYRKVLFIRKLLLISVARLGEGTTFRRKIVKGLVSPFAKLIGSSKLCDIINAQAQAYNFEKCSMIGGVLWGYGPQERLNKNAFLSPISVQFENHFFNAPSNYHEYLTNLYGDYMKLPPLEKRVTHAFDAWWEEIE